MIMKNLISLFVILATLLSGLSAQSVIRFTAQDNLGQYTQLHHVTLQNLTRGWTQQLYFPDTIWVTSEVGVHSYDLDKSFHLYQNVPNPFNGITEFTLNLPYEDQVNVVVYELSGRQIARFSQKLSPGSHTFCVMLQKPQTYLLAVSTSRDKASIKMVNTGGSLSGIRHVSADVPHAVSLKAQMSDPDFPFEPGDDMLYVGYVLIDSSVFVCSDSIRQFQYNLNEDIVLNFHLWKPKYHENRYVDTSALFIPIGVECNGGCGVSKSFLVTGFPNGDFVQGAEDIYFVRLKMEQSDVSDLWINLTCPNGLSASILKTKYQSNSGCYSQIPASEQGWPIMGGSDPHFGWSRPDSYGNFCDPDSNIIGTCWNYCWSDNTTQGYQYAGGNGYVTDYNNLITSNNPYSSITSQYVDSTHVANMTQVYHPHVSFSNLVGCPMNGLWTITLINGNPYTIENGYLAECELRFREDSVIVGYEYDLQPAALAFPGVHTIGVSVKGSNTAVCVGEVTDSGNAALSARGFCWSTSPNPTLNDSHTSGSPYVGVFRDTLTGLSPDITYHYRAYAVNEAGVAYGADKTFVLASGPTCPPSVTDYDGNVYETVQLGPQCWMRENLKTRHFADGTEILIQTQVANNFVTPSYWTSGDTNVYGRLYNLPAAVNCEYLPDSLHVLIQGVCPDGWHLPSLPEWQNLFSYVSGNPAYHCNGNPNKIAKALAFDGLWSYFNESCTIGNELSSNNATGFSMKPAGLGNTVIPPGTEALFWTSSIIFVPDDYPRGYMLDFVYFDDTVEDAIYWSTSVWARSVRCLRDYTNP